MTVDLELVSALLLHLLDLVSMTQQLEVLPCGEEHDGNQKHSYASRPPQLELAILVYFADDRIVPNVLLDGAFKVSRGHEAISQSLDTQATLSAARSLALRARGLRLISSSVGRIGRFVSTRTRLSPSPLLPLSSRKTVFTTRSSSE